MSFVIQPVNLSAAAIQGVLPADHGGTTLTTFGAANRALYSTSATALAANTLPVAAGGTGATSLTANNVLLGNGTSALQTVAPGTSGNVLTSTGTSWSSQTLLAGVITGTASGSISTGNPVQVNTNGTLSAATVTTGASSIGTTDTVTLFSSAGYTVIYCPSPGVYVAFYGDSVNGYVTGRIGTPASNGTVTWSAQTILTTGNTYTGGYSAVYISAGLVVVTAGQGTGSPGIIMPVTVTTTTLTAGTASFSGRSDNYSAVSWNPTLQVGGVLSRDGSTGSTTMTGFTVSGTTVTAGSPVGTYSSNEFNLAFDLSSGYFILIGRVAGNFMAAQAFAISASRVVTEYVLTTVYTGGPSGTTPVIGIVYVPTVGKVLIAAGNDTINPVLFYINLSGTTPSAVGTTTASVQASAKYFALGYDSVNDVVCLTYSAVTTSFKNAICFTPNGTTITLGSATQVNTNASNNNNSGRLAFDTTNQRILLPMAAASIQTVTFKDASTTLTSNNFIGFSKDNYTNGQTAQVYVVSGVATGLSGVSIGVKNYVSGLGVSTTDTGIYAGVGLSATSLLVKG